MIELNNRGSQRRGFVLRRTERQWPGVTAV
jgi:hypothetical protein